MQLNLIDPRLHPVATQVMLHDTGLRDAIRFVRDSVFAIGYGDTWPYVEHLCDIEGRPAWLIDDDGTRYVVIGATVFRLKDFDILDAKIRAAANTAFGRLDAIGRAA